MEKQRRIELIEEAQGKIREAVLLIRQAVKGTSIENGVDGYSIPSLRMVQSKEHGYLARQPYNCDEIIEHFENDEDEEDNAEEDVNEDEEI